METLVNLNRETRELLSLPARQAEALFQVEYLRLAHAGMSAQSHEYIEVLLITRFQQLTYLIQG